MAARRAGLYCKGYCQYFGRRHADGRKLTEAGFLGWHEAMKIHNGSSGLKHELASSCLGTTVLSCNRVSQENEQHGLSHASNSKIAFYLSQGAPSRREDNVPVSRRSRRQRERETSALVA